MQKHNRLTVHFLTMVRCLVDSYLQEIPENSEYDNTKHLHMLDEAICLMVQGLQKKIDDPWQHIVMGYINDRYGDALIANLSNNGLFCHIERKGAVTPPLELT
jgi:hypothetical protein